MSIRNNRNVKGTKGNATKGTKGKKDVPVASSSFGRVLKNKGEDRDVRTQIEDLLSQLTDADRDTQKGIRRRLRSLGYWGGRRTRTNWIRRVPDGKRKDVVSL